MEIRGVKSPIPREWVCRKARDALAILNTSRPVNMAFTARDREKESVPIGLNQTGMSSLRFGPWKANVPTSVSDVASDWVSKRTVLQTSATTYPRLLMLKWKELLPQPVVGSTPPNSGISERGWEENPGFIRVLRRTRTPWAMTSTKE